MNGKITKEFVKSYLRVDGEEEDELIDFLIGMSEEEIKASTGDDGSDPHASTKWLNYS